MENQQSRSCQDNEFELIDTGVFDENRYWDVFVEYFKASPDDILAQITIHNRGPDAAELHVLPQLWFRNTWSWNPSGAKPEISARGCGSGCGTSPNWAPITSTWKATPSCCFARTKRIAPRLYGTSSQGYYKDAFHEYLVHGNRSAVNPLQRGSKACAHLTRAGGGRRQSAQLPAAPLSP